MRALILFALPLLSFMVCGVAVGAEGDAGLSATRLRCEYLKDPIGIDAVKPRLTWQVISSQRGQRQTAYQVIVASSANQLEKGQGDLWDSGKVESDETLHRVYQGSPLTSGQRCFWKVKVWDRSGNASSWSESATWSMGLLEPSDWKATYISYRDDQPVFDDPENLFLPPVRQYRKQFSTISKSPVRRATVYATALGIYELELNGKKVGDLYFAPGWTDYRQRAYYNTYDVTGLLNSGVNAIGASVADGWYSGYCGFGLLTGLGTEQIGRYTYGKTPSLMAQMEIEFEDGSRQTIVTDTEWTVTADGPHREADFLMGQSYDATKEMPGWSSAGFDDSQWEAAIAAKDNGPQPAEFFEYVAGESGQSIEIEGRPVNLGFVRPKLEAYPGVPVRVTQTVTAKSISQPEEGVYVLDMGQNFAGTVRLWVKGPAGHRIKIRYGEMLHPDGRLMTENLRKARSTDSYTCKGDPAGETFSPQFTSHGFQYVELSDFPGQPDLETVTGIVLHSDTPMVSSFECSDAVVNQVYQNVLWTQRANFIELPTDCPQRDERMGWTGDAQAYIATAAFNADVGAFFTKWHRELMESQDEQGIFPGYAPFPFRHGWGFGSGWGDAGVICPWTIWQFYGDTQTIDVCWEPMTRYLDWRKRTSVGDLGIVHGNQWGDWLNQGEDTPLDYIDSVYFALTTRMMAEMAEATGRTDQAADYREQLEKTKAAFIKKYVQDDGGINVPTQTAHALAIFAELVPAELRSGTGQHLAEMIAENGNHMATGFLGTKPLLPVLSELGHHDLAVFLMQSRQFPSWGYEVEQGATTIWERWDGFTKEDGFGRYNAKMNSYSHYSFGAVCEWMFRSLAGINSQGPGFKKIVIRPMPPRRNSNAQRAPIDWVKASYDSIRGMIESNWRLTKGQFELQVKIPANTVAEVWLPASDVGLILESGQSITDHPHVGYLRDERGCVVLQVDSGDYQFSVSSNLKPVEVALKHSQPKDGSLNPESISLETAVEVANWDFGNQDDVDQWAKRKNLDVQVRDEGTFLVATGEDPQLSVLLDRPIDGPVIVRLRMKPEKKIKSKLFWGGKDRQFNSRSTVGRVLNRADKTNDYLFGITSKTPIESLRFDPFDTFEAYANRGEMLIESITVFKQP